jgi:outer membrane usher protein FimD/PapC
MKKLIPFLIVLFLISCKDELLEDIKPKTEEINIDEVEFSDVEASMPNASSIQKIETIEVNKVLTFFNYMSYSSFERQISYEKFDLNGDGKMDIRFLRERETLTPSIYNKYAFVVNGQYLGKDGILGFYDENCDTTVTFLDNKEVVCIGDNKRIQKEMDGSCKKWYSTNVNQRDYTLGAKISLYNEVIANSISENGETKPFYIPFRLNINGNFHNGYIKVSYVYLDYNPENPNTFLYHFGYKTNLKVHSIAYHLIPEARITTPKSI